MTLKARLRVTRAAGGPLLLLEVTGNVTIGQIIHDLVVVELFDVEYYCDLEMWVRGH